MERESSRRWISSRMVRLLDQTFFGDSNKTFKISLDKTLEVGMGK